MKLKDNVDMSAFLKEVESCREDVLFNTAEGDSLNLKSTVSQFVFAAFISGNLHNIDGDVICRNDADCTALSAYLEEA